MKKTIGVLVCGVLLATSGALFAQSYDHGHDNHDNHGQDSHQDNRHDSRHQDSHHYKGMHDEGQHEGWYKRGGRVPSNYRSGRYVVTDWRHDHLRAPPRGYHYVRSDNGDFLLVAISTGIIASILSH